MRKPSILLVAAVLVMALVFSAPKECEGSLIEKFLVSAEKATAFFPGAAAQEPDTPAELAEEAANPEIKTQAELDREQSKSPDEVAREVAEDHAELWTYPALWSKIEKNTDKIAI